MLFCCRYLFTPQSLYKRAIGIERIVRDVLLQHAAEPPVPVLRSLEELDWSGPMVALDTPVLSRSALVPFVPGPFVLGPFVLGLHVQEVSAHRRCGNRLLDAKVAVVAAGIMPVARLFVVNRWPAVLPNGVLSVVSKLLTE